MSTISLLPLGPVRSTILPSLQQRLTGLFGQVGQLESAAIDLGSCYNEPRGQYDSTRILILLRQHLTRLNPKPEKLLAVISDDLFIPVLTFVFGEAELSGNVAVISTFRLENERYGLPRDRLLLDDRLAKEAAHEIGHLLGLIHCHESDCVMRSSTSVEEIDIKSDSFCRDCLERIPPSPS